MKLTNQTNSTALINSLKKPHSLSQQITDSNFLKQLFKCSRFQLATALGLITSGVFGCVGETGPQGPRGAQGLAADQGGEGGATGKDCSVPSSTIKIQWGLEMARDDFESNVGYDLKTQTQCYIENGYTPEAKAKCNETTLGEINFDKFIYAEAVNLVLELNNTNLVECGPAYLITEADKIDPKSFQFIAAQNKAEDSDGDGVDNYTETRMGQNPCNPKSYGQCDRPDSEGDYDGDEILDKDDKLPFCNEQKPLHNGNTCDINY